ncbi:MAG: hypothetical protein WD273_06320 [Trueperaceae bacterium]
MRNRDPLRLPLSLSAVYILLVGITHLIPTLSEPLLGRPVIDPALEALNGTALVTVGAFTALLARQGSRSAAMVWALVGFFVLATVNLVVFWSLGEVTARTALAPIVIHLFFIAWIGSTLARAGAPNAQATGV